MCFQSVFGASSRFHFRRISTGSRRALPALPGREKRRDGGLMEVYGGQWRSPTQNPRIVLRPVLRKPSGRHQGTSTLRPETCLFPGHASAANPPKGCSDFPRREASAMISRREFLATTGAAVATSSVGGVSAAKGEPATGGEKSARLFLPVDDLKPATFDRLPLEWHTQRAQKLCQQLAEDGYTGILLTDRWNIIYFTGLWHTTTERLVNVFLPLKGDPVWFNSALDRDLVKTWWYNDGEMYFDWFHAEGAFPNEGKVQMGAKVDLYLPFVRESTLRVEPVEVHLAVVVPPRFDEVAIERRIEPDRIALQRQKYIH